MRDFDDREQAAFDRTVGLFRTVDPQLRVSDGSWSARDVLAHLVTVARRYVSTPRLADTPRDVDGINAEELSELADLDVSALLSSYADAFQGYRGVWTQMPGGHMWPFHGGGRITTPSLRANWLGEMLVHGYDVASAAGLPWEIGTAEAGDLLAFLREILPTYGRPGPDLSVTLRPDGGQAWSLRVGADGASTADDDPPADAVVSGPGGLIVLVLYQRLTPGDAVAQGLRVDGDPAAVDRLVGCLEQP